MSADEANGLVYLPVSSPSPNYWGGNRVDAIPLGTSTTALDINTGKVVWSRQWVHHDVWDYDINSAPTLMDITVDGKQIPALVQATKQGFLFVVNRLTGRTYGQSKNVRFRRVMGRSRRSSLAHAAIPDQTRAAARPVEKTGNLEAGGYRRWRPVLPPVG